MDPREQRPNKPKKLFFDPSETTTTTTSPSLSGFSKILLPFNSSGSSNSTHDNTYPALRRCASDPTSLPVVGFDSVTGVAANVVPNSPPESAKIAGTNGLTTPASKGSVSLPQPLPLRTVSDSSPSKCFSRSSICNDHEGSNYQRLKKMKDFMNQMSQWWDEYMANEVTSEEEEEAIEGKTVMATKDDSVTDFEEAVSVERPGIALSSTSNVPVAKCIRSFSLEGAVTTSCCRL